MISDDRKSALHGGDVPLSVEEMDWLEANPRELPPKPAPTRYLSAEQMKQDDFGVPFTNQTGEVIYDAKTGYRGGCWATMTQASYDQHAAKIGLGQGRGQKYVRQENGQLWKVEG